MSSTNSLKTPDDISHVPTIELADRLARVQEIEDSGQEPGSTIVDRARQLGTAGAVTLTLLTAAPKFTPSAQAAERDSTHIFHVMPDTRPATKEESASKSIDEVYEVKPGDNLSEISARFRLPLKDEEAINTEIVNKNLIFPGEQILMSNWVCPPKQVEAVPGATVSSFERLYGITQTQFMKENPIVKSADLINAGDCYDVLPNASSKITPEPVIAPHLAPPSPEIAPQPVVPKSGVGAAEIVPHQSSQPPIEGAIAPPPSPQISHVSLPEAADHPAPVLPPSSPVGSIDNLSPTVLAAVEAAGAAAHKASGNSELVENPGFELPVPSPAAAKQAATSSEHTPVVASAPAEETVPTPDHQAESSAAAAPETHHIIPSVEAHISPTIPEVTPQPAPTIEHEAPVPPETSHSVSSLHVPLQPKPIVPQPHLAVPARHPLAIVTGHHISSEHAAAVLPASTVINLPPGIHPDSAQIAAAIAAKYHTPLPTTQAWINAHDPNITGSKIAVPVNPIAGGKLLSTVIQEALTPIVPGTYSVNTNYFSHSGLNANQFNQVLADTGLAGLGPQVAYEEQTTGINGMVLVSHADIESADGDSYYARTRNNLFGMGAYDSDPNHAYYYPTKAASIAAYVQLLMKNYLTAQGEYYGGSTTISSVFVHYSTAGQAEAASVAKLANIESEKAAELSEPTPPAAAAPVPPTAQQIEHRTVSHFGNITPEVPTVVANNASFMWPFPTKGQSQIHRTDEGLDLQGLPNQVVQAVAPGTMESAVPNPGGFGKYAFEVVDPESVPVGSPSDTVYYGHVLPLASVIGKHVAAGQIIAIANATNGELDNGARENGSAAPPGWLEIGFAVHGTGDPLDHTPGATVAGQQMKNLLINAPVSPVTG